ncbi:SsgA family sporulation/cell division regulator [Streptomyces microflavus]|uniref:SsgA family sporulation/cell division regulator n=1 Tax=Streptomyces microflavus TaxID=1919 RepID=UPI003B20D558
MDNATATVNDDDFDALLEASSLGAPRVLAALGTATPDARRRFDHAARHPQAHFDETLTAVPDRTADHTQEPVTAASPATRPAGTGIVINATGSGKTAIYIGLMQRAASAAAEAGTDHHLTDLLDCYSVLERARRARWAAFHVVHPRALLLDQCAAVFEQAGRAHRDTAEEANPWSRTMQAYWAALLSARPEALRPASAPFVPLWLRNDILEQGGGFGESEKPAPPLSAGPERVLPAYLDTAGAAGLAAKYLSRTARQDTAVQPVSPGQRTRDALPRLPEVLEELKRLLTGVERLADQNMQEAQRSPSGLAPRPPRVTLIVSDQLASWLQLITYTDARQLRSRQQLAMLTADGPMNSVAMRQVWETPRILLDGLLAPCLLPVPPRPEEHGHSAAGKLLHWMLLKAALADTALTGDHWRLADNVRQPGMPEMSCSAALLHPWAHAPALPCPDTPPKSSIILWSPDHDRSYVQHTPYETRLTQSCPDDETSTAGPAPTVHTQTVHTEITALLHLDKQHTSTQPLPTCLSYRATDPYAVEVTFEPGGATVTWTFARDLLTEGLHARTGDGDVAVWTSAVTSVSSGDSDDTRIYIELSAPLGTALVSLPQTSVEEFLNQTLSLVPPGTEQAHIDSSLLDLETRLDQLTAHPGCCD